MLLLTIRVQNEKTRSILSSQWFIDSSIDFLSLKWDPRGCELFLTQILGPTVYEANLTRFLGQLILGIENYGPGLNHFDKNPSPQQINYSRWRELPEVVIILINMEESREKGVCKIILAYRVSSEPLSWISSWI